MRDYQSIAAQCPFYRREDEQKVYCEGVKDDMGCHQAFKSPQQASDYKWRYCYSGYTDCLVYRMLLKKHEKKGG